jgi:hypothetical protein
MSIGRSGGGLARFRQRKKPRSTYTRKWILARWPTSESTLLTLLESREQDGVSTGSANIAVVLQLAGAQFAKMARRPPPSTGRYSVSQLLEMWPQALAERTDEYGILIRKFAAPLSMGLFLARKEFKELTKKK